MSYILLTKFQIAKSYVRVNGGAFIPTPVPVAHSTFAALSPPRTRMAVLYNTGESTVYRTSVVLTYLAPSEALREKMAQNK